MENVARTHGEETMPNTLAHLGAQALVSRGIIRDAELKWVYLGCLIPDFPWIAQRAVSVLIPSIDPYDLRLYVTAQASLAGSLLLAGSLAAASQAPRRTFPILALNCLLHLLLDALQTKWANGVHLLAPFSWRIWNVGLFWPESAPTYALSGLGLAYVLWAACRRSSPAPISFQLRSSHRAATALGLLMLYLALPFLWAPAVERSDSHFVQTLRDHDARTGRVVEFDRASYVSRPGVAVIRTFAGEELKLPDSGLHESAQVSIRAMFLDPDTLRLRELHLLRAWIRVLASYLGLALVEAVWMGWIPRALRSLPRSPNRTR